MGTIGAILSWIIFGFVVGLLARALYPGKQKLGVPNTIALGIGGSIVGGLIAWALGYRPDGGAFQGAGWIMSIVGALIVVWGATALGAKRCWMTPLALIAGWEPDRNLSEIRESLNGRGSLERPARHVMCMRRDRHGRCASSR